MHDIADAHFHDWWHDAQKQAPPRELRESAGPA
jgi:hypothetical protein